MKLALIFAVLAISACNLNGPTAPATTSGVTSGGSSPSSSGAKYVYVLESPGNDMLVYPAAGGPNAAPVEKVAFDTEPMCAATDHEGNVYISLLHDNEVLEYDSGATKIVDRYSMTFPRGLSVDAADKLYVSSGTQIFVFTHGSQRIARFMTAANDQLVNAVAVDAKGNVFADATIAGGGAIVQRFSVGSADGVPTHMVAAGAGGIAFDSRGILTLASPNQIRRFTSPFGPKPAQVIDYGVGTEVGCLNSGPGGSVYVPVYNPLTGVSKVMVYPASAAAPYAITQGLAAARAATAGI